MKRYADANDKNVCSIIGTVGMIHIKSVITDAGTHKVNGEVRVEESNVLFDENTQDLINTEDVVDAVKDCRLLIKYVDNEYDTYYILPTNTCITTSPADPDLDVYVGFGEDCTRLYKVETEVTIKINPTMMSMWIDLYTVDKNNYIDITDLEDATPQ